VKAKVLGAFRFLSDFIELVLCPLPSTLEVEDQTSLRREYHMQVNMNVQKHCPIACWFVNVA